MASNIKDIRQLIVDKLEAMIDENSDPIFKQVFPYAQGDFTQYPVAVVKPTGGRGAEIDTHRNERIYEFVVSLYQEQSQAGKTKIEADAIMTKCSDALLKAFDEDKTLGDEVQIVKVVQFDLDFKVAAGTFNFGNFRIECLVVVPNY